MAPPAKGFYQTKLDRAALAISTAVSVALAIVTPLLLPASQRMPTDAAKVIRIGRGVDRPVA